MQLFSLQLLINNRVNYFSVVNYENSEYFYFRQCGPKSYGTL